MRPVYLTLPLLLAACADPGVRGNDTPYGLFIADGTFDPLDASYTPPAFDDFFIERLGMDLDGIDALRTDAKRFYLDVYGLDVDAEVQAGTISWNELRFDPRGEYRVYDMPGLDIPAEGWFLDDVVFAPLVVAPEGVVLGAPYEGVVASPGMLGAWGTYAIEAPEGQILIDYHSEGLAANAYDGKSLLTCVMQSDELGYGEGYVTSKIIQEPDGQLRYDFANIQTWGLDPR